MLLREDPIFEPCSTYNFFKIYGCYSKGLTAFLNLLRKDLGGSKPRIFPREQAHQPILW
jgi:hypothetical protein